ncbi:MAG: phytoene desaturase family protein [Gemmobacter sp.]
MSLDAVIVGAGHNGLVAACYLARAGLRVCVVEKNDWIGGAAVSRELYPGLTYSNCSYVNSLFRPEIMRDLDLARHGLQILPYEGGALLTGQGYLGMHRDHDANRREIARHSPRDAEAYDLYARDVLRHCRFIRPLLMRTPPDPARFRPRDLGELIWLGRHISGLSERAVCDMIRFWTMSISDFLDGYFENPAVKAYQAVGAIIGTALGPMSPGTAYVLLHHAMGDVDGNVGAWGYARGGMGAITQALAASLRASGGEIRTGAGVESVLVEGGRACGVVLEGGDEVRAARVLSNMDVRRTFLRHVDEREVPGEFMARVKRFKTRGSSGKLNIALDRAPRFTALPEDAPYIKGDLHFTPTIAAMERAYDDWKAGTFSADPFQDVMIPTMIDPTMAPAGKHFMSCFVQYAPPKIRGADWSDADRDAFGRTCIDQIEAHAPGFRASILHVEVRTPRELEAEVGLTEGNIFQGELTFDQLLFNRPVPGYAQYRTPVRDLYLCGSSTHPGGGVMGAPGRNAAREVLRDMARAPKDMRDAYAVL